MPERIIHQEINRPADMPNFSKRQEANLAPVVGVAPETYAFLLHTWASW